MNSNLKLLVFTVAIFMTFASCSNKKKDNGEDLLNNLSKEMNLKLTERAVFLSYKHNVDEEETKRLLLEYLKNFNNISYQIIVEGRIDKDNLLTNSATDYSVTTFIREQSVTNGFSKSTIANVIFDYQQLLTKEELENIRVEIEELELRIEELENK